MNKASFEGAERVQAVFLQQIEFAAERLINGNG